MSGVIQLYLMINRFLMTHDNEKIMSMSNKMTNIMTCKRNNAKSYAK